VLSAVLRTISLLPPDGIGSPKKAPGVDASAEETAASSWLRTSAESCCLPTASSASWADPTPFAAIFAPVTASSAIWAVVQPSPLPGTRESGETPWRPSSAPSVAVVRIGAS
jgi:hypothetical protein